MNAESHLKRAEEIAFGRLETIRHGRWYGGKGNGKTVSEVLKILNQIVR